MNNCRVSSEELEFDRKQSAKDSIPHMVKCLECKEVKPAEEMHLIAQYFDDEGCCDDCAMNEDVKIEWGFQ